MNPLTLLMLLFTVSGLVLIGISIPLIQRRVKPNYWYGYRTKRTLSDPAMWYKVNAHAGQRLFVSGFITASAAIVLYSVPRFSVDGYSLGMLICSLFPLVIGLLQSSRYLDRLCAEDRPFSEK